MNGTDERRIEVTTFDRAVKILGSGASRRSIVRGLTAGLVGVAGGGIAPNVLAKKKKNKNKKRKKGRQKNKQQTVPQTTPPATPPLPEQCPRGTRIAYLSVPSNGSQIFTPVLTEGQPYLLRASGYWSTNGDYMNDAFAAFLWKDQRSPLLYNNGVRLGLAVNGESPDLWGSYSQSHTYNLVVIGKGQPVSLQMLDSVYSDNGRLLNVEVLCAAPLRD